METKIELIPGIRVTIETNSDGSTVAIYEPETPSYQFKDGDFVRSIAKNKKERLYIYKGLKDDAIIFYAVLMPSSDLYFGSPCQTGIGYTQEYIEHHLMTDSEKQRFINALKANGKQWDAENKCIVDIQPKFKDGDFIYTEYEDEKCIGILKRDYKGEDQPIELYCAMFGITTIIDNFRIGAERKRHDRLATGSEMQEIVKLFENRGLFWNPISKKVEKIRWEPKVGDIYFYIDRDCFIYQTRFYENDKNRISTGNFFKTHKQAIDASERVKKLFAEIQADLYK